SFQFNGPHTYFSNLEGIEHVHCNRVRALVGQMSPDTTAEPFVRLADVNRFSVVIVKGVDAALDSPETPSFLVQGFEKGLYLLANLGNVLRKPCSRGLNGCRFCHTLWNPILHWAPR